jgi:hypothetical protein
MLASVSLKFGLVNRVTHHRDGQTPESDTDHTVMLSLIACSLAANVNAEREKCRDLFECTLRIPLHLLDIGKVAQYALVHDLVEVYAGDTATLRISEEARRRKEQREKEALDRLIQEFQDLPWLVQTLTNYERLADQEARFVKVVDKAMPKVVNILNGGASYRRNIPDVREVPGLNLKQLDNIKITYGSDQSEALDFLAALSAEVAEMADEWEGLRGLSSSPPPPPPRSPK